MVRETISPRTKPAALLCPRCGYDLSGQRDAWFPQGAECDGATCPCESTCSECGLVFEWRLLLNESLVTPAWFFETALHRKFRALCLTWWLALRPWSFWKRIHLEIRPNLTRLAISVTAVLLLLVVLHAFIGIGGRTLVNYTDTYPLNIRWNGTRFKAPLDELRVAWTEYRGWVSWIFSRNALLPWMGIVLGMIVMPPIMLLCLPWTMARSKVQHMHIARASGYTLAFPLAIFVLVLVCDFARYAVWGLGVPRQNAYHSFAGSLGALHPLNNNGRWSGTGGSLAVRLYPWIALAWYLTYWWHVLRHGWRMSDYRRVYIAVAIPALLLSLILMLFIPGALTWSV